MSQAYAGVTALRSDLSNSHPLQPAVRQPVSATQPSVLVVAEDVEILDAKRSVAADADKVSLDELSEMLQCLNLTFDLFEIQASFSLSEEGNEVRVVLRNTRTGEVIRRIPPGELLQNFSSFKDSIGLLYNRIF